MKTRAILPFALVAAGIGLWLGACSYKNKTVDPVHNVMFHKNEIILPGTRISPADQAALNAVLKRYDKSLYRIQVYQDGKLEKTLGLLSMDIIRRGTGREVATNAQRASGWSLQVGVGDLKGAIIGVTGDKPRFPLPPPPNPLSPPMLLAQSKDLVRQIEITLGNYRTPSGFVQGH